MLKQYNHIPGWENVFLTAIRNGYNEKTAANAARVGTGDIRSRLGKNPRFREKYEEAVANRKSRPVGGLF